MDCEQITVHCNQTPHDEMICCKAMDLLEEKLVVQVTVDQYHLCHIQPTAQPPCAVQVPSEAPCHLQH